MKAIVAGGTGFLGQRLVERLSARGDEVVVLTRSPEGRAARELTKLPGVRALASSSKEDVREPWWNEVDGADAVINLVGESVAGSRWTDAHKRRILESRVQSTRAVRDAIAAAKTPPRVVVNASGVGYYGLRDEAPIDESAGPGDDFLAKVCRAWEEEAAPIAALGPRLVLLRIGVVLGEAGGALDELLPIFKLGVGGPLGDGKQWFPWVHLDDVVGLMLLALDSDALSGPVNAVAPGGMNNRDFSKTLGRVLHRPTFLGAPKFAVKLMMGEAAQIVLGGQHPIPAAAQRAGYAFRWPELEPALRALLHRE